MHTCVFPCHWQLLWAFSSWKMDVGYVTCAAILTSDAHTKPGQALLSVTALPSCVCHFPVNMPDLICIWSRLARKHCPEMGQMILAQWLASRQDSFGQNMTQSARSKSHLAWFCTVWSELSVEEHNQVWKRETGGGLVAFCQKLGPIILAHQLALGPDAFGQNLTKPSRSDLGQICTICSRPSLELNRMREVWSSIYNLARFWLHAGRNGYNWP